MLARVDRGVLNIGVPAEHPMHWRQLHEVGPRADDGDDTHSQVLWRRTRAGLPTTTARSGTLLVTTAPAPTTACSPIVIPGSKMAPLPIAARRLTSVRSSVQRDLRTPCSVAAGLRSFRKFT